MTLCANNGWQRCSRWAAMPRSRSTFSQILAFRANSRFLLWSALTAFTLWMFIYITSELVEGEPLIVDRVLIIWAARVRSPWLTAAALDVTALGSVTLVLMFAVFALVVLTALRDRNGVLQLVAASVGAAILTSATKNIVERVRPSVIPRLVEVSGFSYPSGHATLTTALYVTIGIIAARHVSQPRVRAMIFLATSVVLLLVGVSRIYLGVHYPTDVASGISLGLAWALLLAGFFALLAQRRSGIVSVI
jgi:undecaprenyl-diphosphatase